MCGDFLLAREDCERHVIYDGGICSNDNSLVSLETEYDNNRFA